MSIRVCTQVWDRSSQKGAALLLLLAIGDFCHDDGRGAYPAIKTLAHKTRLHEGSVKRLIRDVERSGELSTEIGAGPKGVNVYTIHLDRLGLEGGTPEPPPQNVPPPQSVPQGVTKRNPGGVTEHTPKPLVEPSVNRQEKTPPSPSWPEHPSMDYLIEHDLIPNVDSDGVVSMDPREPDGVTEQGRSWWKNPKGPGRFIQMNPGIDADITFELGTWPPDPRDFRETFVGVKLSGKDQEPAWWAEQGKRFYQAYPRKAKPRDAERAWAKIKPQTPEHAGVIMAGLEAAKKAWTQSGTEAQFIPYPATWLNAGSWEDDHAATAAAIKRTPATSTRPGELEAVPDPPSDDDLPAWLSWLQDPRSARHRHYRGAEGQRLRARHLQEARLRMQERQDD